jgi:Zn-dependent protease
MALETAARALGDAGCCPACGCEVAPGLLSCPACHRLVHGERLKALARAAEEAEAASDLPAALASWREALALLPPQTRQAAIISERVTALCRRVESSPAPQGSPSIAAAPAPTATGGPGWSKSAATGVLGTLALAAWKLKFLAVMVLGKAKLLLLGLTKASTFFSMFAMVGVYWTAFGLWFALGFVLSIYIHEMGHVAALMRYGVAASAPLFIPGLGAVIRLRQEFTDHRVDARVALAGPIWGAAAAIGCSLAYFATRQNVWAALASTGAMINLLNLIPIWQLDGGRVFRSLDRPQRWLAVTALAVAWSVTEDGLLLLLMLVGAARAAIDRPSDRPDRGALAQYIALIAVLSFVSHFPPLVIAKP